MIGIVIVTHGALAREFLSVAEHVVGKQQHVVSIGIGPEDDIERRRHEAAKLYVTAVQQIAH